MEHRTIVVPGYDHKYGPDKKPDDGIHDERWVYVVTDGNVAMSLEVGTGKYPDSVPDLIRRQLLNTTRPSFRGDTLALHASYRVDEDDIREDRKGDECQYLIGGVCWRGGTGHHAASSFFETHGSQTLEQSETFWTELEAMCRLWEADASPKRHIHQCTACKGTGIIEAKS